MNQVEYLKRLSMQSALPTLEYLTQLQRSHVFSVPFENLDVIRRTPIYLNLETIYEKIVKQHRGGYCYELNGLFHHFLQLLGFDAQLVSATVFKPDGTWAKEKTHATIIVHLDQAYLVDVGFGAYTPRMPVPINGHATNSINEIYSIVSSSGLYHLKRKGLDETEKILYAFDCEQKALIDFHEGCVFNQVSQDSTFTHHDIVAIGTDSGRIILNDQTLTIKKHEKKIQTVLSKDDKINTLKEVFSISLK